MHIKCRSQNITGTHHLSYVDTDGKIVPKFKLQKCGVTAWTGFTWHWTGISKVLSFESIRTNIPSWTDKTGASRGSTSRMCTRKCTFI